MRDPAKLAANGMTELRQQLLDKRPPGIGEREIQLFFKRHGSHLEQTLADLIRQRRVLEPPLAAPPLTADPATQPDGWWKLVPVNETQQREQERREEVARDKAASAVSRGEDFLSAKSPLKRIVTDHLTGATGKLIEMSEGYAVIWWGEDAREGTARFTSDTVTVGATEAPPIYKLLVADEWIRIADLADARRKVLAFIAKVGAENWSGGRLLQDGRTIAYLNHEGRIFDSNTWGEIDTAGKPIDSPEDRAMNRFLISYARNMRVGQVKVQREDGRWLARSKTVTHIFDGQSFRLNRTFGFDNHPAIEITRLK